MNISQSPSSLGSRNYTRQGLLTNVDTGVFTVDWKAAMDVTALAGLPGGNGYVPWLLDLFPKRGAAPNDSYRVMLFLGEAFAGANPGLTNTLTIFDSSGYTEVIVAGLDVGELNTYRVVGTGGGAFNLYWGTNNVALHSGTAASINDSRAGNVSFSTQIAADMSAYTADNRIDFLRVLDGTALDYAPVPEPSVLFLIGLGGLLVLRRRKKVE